MINQRKWYFCIALFLFFCAVLWGQTSHLQTTEVSRFAFSCHDWATNRYPVIDYPYVYLPNSYGFQVTEWDSTAGSFTEIANFGIGGMTTEMAQTGNFMFAAVAYNPFTNVEPDMGALYRIDISDPLSPIAAGAIPSGTNNLRFSSLRVVNGYLLAQKQVNGLLESIVIIDPITFSIVHSYPSYLYYEVIPGNFVITRATNETNFSIFTVNDSGLTEVGSVTLPYGQNTFPYFITINEELIGSQDHTGLHIWQFQQSGDWTQHSFIELNNASRGSFCNGYLVFNDHTGHQSRFLVYDISNPTVPILTGVQDFPAGAEISPMSDLLYVYGEFIFFPCSDFGCLCLRMNSTGEVQFVSKCYRYNDYAGAGHKYGDYALLPVRYSGIACFDISDPFVPEYSFTILADQSAWIDLNGHYMFGIFDHILGSSYYRVYNISALSDPILIYEQLATPYNTIFCNKNEPQSFYMLNTQTDMISKYDISNDMAYSVLEYQLGYTLQSPVFANGLLYLSELGAAYNADLYVYSGMSNNAPQLAQILPDLVPQPGYFFSAGEYLFLRNLTSPDSPSIFYHPQGAFQVENDIHWGYFRNYVCVSSELGVSFYDTEGYPTGFITASYYMPQDSYVWHIQWDDKYMYLFSQDNVAIYSYSTTETEDAVNVPAGPSLLCYPNPMSAELTIDVKTDMVTAPVVDVYNLKGQLVRRLPVTSKTQDGYKMLWDGRNYSGHRVAAGLYFISSSINGKRSNAKVIVLGR